MRKMVYVLGNSKVYHAHKYCPALERTDTLRLMDSLCVLTLEVAKKIGADRPCRRCHN